MGTSQINWLSGFIGLQPAQPDQLTLWLHLSSLNSTPHRVSLSEQQHSQQSYKTATPSADFNYRLPGHRNQPPTSNSKSSSWSSALCKWLPTLPQNQGRQHSYKAIEIKLHVET
jgi:hypothetical protein